MWWERVVKKQMRELLTGEGTMRRKEDISLENFYHAYIWFTTAPTTPP
jgi:hypothetical protein